MPALSSWNTPVAAPLAQHLVGVLRRRAGCASRSISDDPASRSIAPAWSSTVSVLRPSRSNFTSPDISAYFIENWVAGISERGSR